MAKTVYVYFDYALFMNYLLSKLKQNCQTQVCVKSGISTGNRDRVTPLSFTNASSNIPQHQVWQRRGVCPCPAAVAELAV